MLDIPKTNLVSTIEVPGLQTNPLKIGVGSKEKAPSSEKGEEAPSLGPKEILIRAVSEICGTAVLVFVGCISCVNNIGSGVNHLTICLAFGIAVLIVVQVFGHISGSHVNPAVTVAAFILGEMKHFGLFPVYIISQMIGATIGYALIWVATPSNLFIRMDPVTNQTIPGFCVTMPNPNISSLQGVLVEAILTGILIWTCAGVWDPRNSTKHDSVPVRFGLTVAGLAISGGIYTGASMNPARSFGPALVSGHWKQHWVYWIGPLTGSIVTATFYRLVFSVPPQKPVSHEEIQLENSTHRPKKANV